MTTTRFDQIAGKDHGSCVTCGVLLPTEQDAKYHRKQTMEGGRSHRTRSSSPSRADRIEREVSDLIDDAISDALSRIDSLINSEDITEEEAKTAIRSQHIDLDAEWEDYTS